MIDEYGTAPLFGSSPLDLPQIDRVSAWVSVDHPDTSRRMQARAAKHLGSFRRTTLAWFHGHDGGTDDAVEQALGRSHQSYSACRRGLVKDGYLTDSGRRADTRYGNPAIVWTLTDLGRARVAFETAKVAALGWAAAAPDARAAHKPRRSPLADALARVANTLEATVVRVHLEHHRGTTASCDDKVCVRSRDLLAEIEPLRRA